MGYLSTLGRAILGRPVALSNSGYNGATSGRRMINAGSSTRGVTSLALSDGPMLTGRARKAVMDNPLASNGITAFVAETIGTGIRPHSRHSDPVIRRNLEREFALWVPQSSATRRIGPGGKPDSLQSFFVQQQLVCRNVVEAGEAFGRLRYRTAADLSPTGLRVPLQIDLIEPEQLAYWRQSGEGMLQGNIMRASIEFNPIHERVAYHFYREHPGDSSIWPNAFEIVRIPADSVLHVMEFIRGNQIRGITALAPILVALSDLDDTDDAERMRQKLGAYLFGWRKTLQPDDPQFTSNTTAGSDTAPVGSAYVDVQPGTVNMLDTNAGEEFGFYEHPGAANNAEFMRMQRHIVSTAMRVAYDMATGDTSGSNYSRSRIRLIALRRVWQQFQMNVMEHQFCRPVWRAWLDAAALAGVIDAADYRKRPEEYLNVEWLPQPWEWVDPVADMESIRMELEAALTSREAESAALGRDVEETDAAIKRDHDREAELGIYPIFGKSTTTISDPTGLNGDDEEVEDTPAAPPKVVPIKGK